jgi:hypothetical protein
MEDDMKFADIQVGVRFIIFPGMPKRIFTKVKDHSPDEWPADIRCGVCGQHPVKLNAFEYGERGKKYHHICPQTTLAQVLFEDKNGG